MTIRIGIGGWTYEPWRGTFYPDKWPQKRELEYAAGKLTAIEVNGTYYSGFKPATFASWRDQVPDDFMFALKASRYCTNRKVLAEAGASIERFVGQGIVELGDKLGPILWQFMATKKFDAADFGAFLKLLPAKQDGIALRHAVQVRHESFAVPEFVAMCRAAGVVIVYAQSNDYPAIADVTGDFVYARLETATEDEPLGYSTAELDRWATAAETWQAGGRPDDLHYISEAPARIERDVFHFFIAGAKVRNPAAAQALIDRV
ncbi:DUF72 domain-containing protein [Sphingomonas oligophenolica]|uniref:DUF72 domain-containing protein n=1 Tax=Sphingomonas oligophenolica TaxID=301154 RepID=A0A502CCC5_9SPHN|nr:DUF72 domain-containing protein [Sphingomonas oligophenolica]TPG10362.1 DUF72 domain-containing protein [Sphingomonas oligophenolica]